jgi:hypothetical protein
MQLAACRWQNKALTMRNTATTLWLHQFCKTWGSHTGIDKDSSHLWYDALSTGKYCNYLSFGGASCLHLLVLSSPLFLECLDSDPKDWGSQLFWNITIYQLAWCHITDGLTVHQFCLCSVPEIQYRNYVLANCDSWKSYTVDANNFVTFTF